MTELELEKTYLPKRLPEGIEAWNHEVITDTYVPAEAVHPTLRVRARGNRYELTKKVSIDSSDASAQHEHTVPLSEEEYAALAAASDRSFTKRRYYGTIEGAAAEVDVYDGALRGLVVIDFEFDSTETMSMFAMPELCMADVTQDALTAGGMLAGKSYADIKIDLEEYGYQPLYLDVSPELYATNMPYEDGSAMAEFNRSLAAVIDRTGQSEALALSEVQAADAPYAGTEEADHTKDAAGAAGLPAIRKKGGRLARPADADQDGMVDPLVAGRPAVDYGSSSPDAFLSGDGRAAPEAA